MRVPGDPLCGVCRRIDSNVFVLRGPSFHRKAHNRIGHQEPHGYFSDRRSNAFSLIVRREGRTRRKVDDEITEQCYPYTSRKLKEEHSIQRRVKRSIESDFEFEIPMTLFPKLRQIFENYAERSSNDGIAYTPSQLEFPLGFEGSREPGGVSVTFHRDRHSDLISLAMGGTMEMGQFRGLEALACVTVREPCVKLGGNISRAFNHEVDAVDTNYVCAGTGGRWIRGLHLSNTIFIMICEESRRTHGPLPYGSTWRFEGNGPSNDRPMSTIGYYDLLRAMYFSKEHENNKPSGIVTATLTLHRWYLSHQKKLRSGNILTREEIREWTNTNPLVQTPLPPQVRARKVSKYYGVPHYSSVPINHLAHGPAIRLLEEGAIILPDSCDARPPWAQCWTLSPCRASRARENFVRVLQKARTSSRHESAGQRESLLNLFTRENSKSINFSHHVNANAGSCIGRIYDSIEGKEKYDRRKEASRLDHISRLWQRNKKPGSRHKSEASRERAIELVRLLNIHRFRSPPSTMAVQIPRISPGDQRFLRVVEGKPMNKV